MPRSPLLTQLCLLAGMLVCPLSAARQDPPPAVPAAPQQDPAIQPLDPITQKALERLATQLREKRDLQRAAVARNDLPAAAALETEVRELSWQFAGLVSRLDVQGFEGKEQRDFDLQRELEQLIRPLLTTIKDATAEPRQVADMKARIEVLQQRQRTAETAQRAVERMRAALPADSPALAEIDGELRNRWRPTIETLRGEILVLQAQLQARAESQKSLVGGISDAVQNFVQKSGASLLLSILVFLAVFLGLRWLVARLLRRRTAERAFSLRMLEVVLQALSLVLAITATLVVPYVRNDWLLLAVCIVFLIGAGWALVRMLPQFFEQIRLVLNIGGVREGERILIDGLPFRVESLRLHSRLDNPDLQGGSLRVPIQYLIGKQSRRSGPDEPWFPCRQGDVVELADGVTGAVQTQTPDMVVVEHRGAPRCYPTAEFLRQTPRNLSRGFVLRTTFGLDYRHQADATTTVPARMQAAVHAGLSALVAAGELLHVRAELHDAGPSSLDFTVLTQFQGSAAPRYLELQRRVPALLVALCSEQGWTIPFPQLTVHKQGPA